MAECCCCGLSGFGFGEELYKDWDNHPAVQQYTFIKRLGEGGFSEVQLARDMLTGKSVVLKIVFLNKAGLNAEQRRILAGEAKLIRMVAHPNIIRCMQVLETRRQQVLVLEHLSGGEMLQQLQRVKRYTEAHACQLFRQVADAVAYCHGLSIMHRDIKPENCLLAKPAQHYTAKGKPVKVKLIDLGMAGLYRPARPLYGCMGSPGFIAPEVVLGDAHTPAMDVYSLGVLLFVMLVGRKPWDSQRSHTLQYAIQPTSEAPGLSDPVFLALSPAARQLLLAMLQEEPAARPTAAQVLGHTWMLQGTAAAAHERLIQPAVQQRLRMLGNSRQVMGTARGMMLLHSNGSRSGAVAFHRAVKEARLKLQQQAAALKAAGQLQELEQGAAAAAAADTAGVTTISACSSAATRPAAGSGDGAAAGASCNTATGPLQLAGAVTEASASGGASRPSSTASGAAQSSCQPGATVGQLARASLQRQSLLFDGKRPPAAPTAAAAPGNAAGAGRGAGAAARGPGAAGAVGAGCGGAVSPDPALMCEALERGMSVPNPDVMFSSGEGYTYAMHRADRAVSLSPGALALLDADDRLCLLAAGTSADDDSTAAFSWANRRGAADMVASFKQHYPVKPIMRSIARFGQSISTSLSRSLRNSTGGLSSYRSGRYTPAAAAAGAAGSPSGQCSTACPPAARMLSLSSGAGSSDLDQLLADNAADSCQLAEGNTMDSSADAAAAASGGNSSSEGVKGSSSTVGVGVAAAAAEGACAYCRSPSRLARERPAGAVQQEADGVSNARTGAVVLSVPAADAAVATSAANPSGAAASRASAAHDSKSAGASALVGSSSAGGSLELAFLGTQLSMSPPMSPPAAAVRAGKAVAFSNSLSPEAALPAAGYGIYGRRSSANRQHRPPPAAAAAAANTHFRRQQAQQQAAASKQQQQAQQQQQVLQEQDQQLQQFDMLGQQLQQSTLQWRDHIIHTLSHVLPAIPSEASGSGSSAGQLAGGDTLEDAAAAAAAGVDEDEPGPAVMAGAAAAGHVGTSISSSIGKQQQRQSAAAAVSGQQGSKGSSSSSAADRSALNRAVLSSKSTAASAGSSAAESAPAAMASGLRTKPATRAVEHSPSVRAAATAAAARAEEEGSDLPNGLWLQRSQSLESSQAFNFALIPALSASSALVSPIAASEHHSMAHLEFGMQQEVEGRGDDEIHSESSSNGQQCQGSGELVEADAAEAAAGGGVLQQRQPQLLHSKHTAGHRHTRDVSMVEWLDSDVLDAIAGGGREVSIIDWLGPGPLLASATAAEAAEDAGDAADTAEHIAAESGVVDAAAVAQAGDGWMNRTSSSDQPASAAAGLGAAARSSTRSSSGRLHVRPTRRVAVPLKQASNHSMPWRSKHSLRGVRRTRSTSSDGAGIAPVIGSNGSEQDAAVGGRAGAAAVSGRDSGELEFYVGSFTDHNGLAGTQELGLGDRLSASLNPEDIEEAVLRHAAEGLAGSAAAAAPAVAAAGGDDDGSGHVRGRGDSDGMLQGNAGDADAADADGGQVLLEQLSSSLGTALSAEAAADTAVIVGISQAAAAAAAGAAGLQGRSWGGVSAAAALGPGGRAYRRSSSSGGKRVQLLPHSQAGMLPAAGGIGLGDVQVRGGHAAAKPGQIGVSGMGMGEVGWKLPARQQHHRHRKQDESSFDGHWALGASGPVDSTAWTASGATSAAAAGVGRAASSSGMRAAHGPGGAADLSAAEAAAGTVAVDAAGNAARRAGGVAWLVKVSSGKHNPPEGNGDGESAAAQGQQRQQPTFDDFDEPNAWYYAS